MPETNARSSAQRRRRARRQLTTLYKYGINHNINAARLSFDPEEMHKPI